MILNWNIDSNPKIRIGIRKFEFTVNRTLLHNFILLMVLQRNSTRESNKVLSSKFAIEPCCIHFLLTVLQPKFAKRKQQGSIFKSCDRTLLYQRKIKNVYRTLGKCGFKPWKIVILFIDYEKMLIYANLDTLMQLTQFPEFFG